MLNNLSLQEFKLGVKPWGLRGALAPPAPPKKSINIFSIILCNTINAFKNYINK